MKHKAPPEKLYLQWHGSGTPEPNMEVDDGDVTWCRDKIWKHDFVYVLVKRKKRKTK